MAALFHGSEQPCDDDEDEKGLAPVVLDHHPRTASPETEGHRDDKPDTERGEKEPRAGNERPPQSAGPDGNDEREDGRDERDSEVAQAEAWENLRPIICDPAESDEQEGRNGVHTQPLSQAHLWRCFDFDVALRVRGKDRHLDS